MTNLASQIRAAVEAGDKSLFTELLSQAADLLDHKDTQINTRRAAPVEGLETIGYVHRGTAGLLMEGAVSKAVIVPKPGGDFKHAVVFAEQVEAIIAAERAENATLKVGIKRLSDEQELLSETTDTDLISVVKLAARLSEAEADHAALTARVKELDDECNDLVKRNNEAVATIDNWINSCAASDEKVQALENQLAAANKRTDELEAAWLKAEALLSEAALEDRP